MINKIIMVIGIIIIFFSPNVLAIYPLAVSGKNGMVVSEHALASEIGIKVLQQGGNAVDAAVAVGYTLAVVLPCCGNIGGGGFMLIHLANGKEVFINFREKAPLAVKQAIYLDSQGKIIPDKSVLGYAAVGVPGTVLGFEQALKKYGTMTRQQVMAPAIALAEHGFLLMPGNIQDLAKAIAIIKKQPNVAGIFLKDNKLPKIGDRLIQKNLAITLQKISRQGSDIFYQGEIANDIVKASQQQGGVLSNEDFTTYNVEELPPIKCSYRDYTILTAPLPSSGGYTLCQMLNILEGYPLASYRLHSAQSIHYITEAMRYTFADRNTQLGDRNYVNTPLNIFNSKAYAAKIRSQIQPFRATPSSSLPYQESKLESTDTTHFSVADKQGNLVAVTYTLNGLFGAGVIAGNTGFLLNNQMDDFTIKLGSANQFGLLQGKPNFVQPAKRPLSSMTPTIIFKDDKPLLIMGSRGGPRIITSVLQVILNVIDYKLDIQSAVDEARFHHQWWPDILDIEKGLLTADTAEKLGYMGYQLREREPWSVVEAIYINPDTQAYEGANDDRAPSGKAVGY